MTDEEQRRIFAYNLRNYIADSGKQQKDVAADLGYSVTTFNTWCMGKILPSCGKIQKIADYFGIGKSDLLDDKSNAQQVSTFMSLFDQLDPDDQAWIIGKMTMMLEAKKTSGKVG